MQSYSNLARVLVLFLAGVMAGCAALRPLSDPPRVSIVDLRPVGMTLFEQRYRLRLRIQNPNADRLAVTGMSYELALNGHRFADGVSPKAFMVGPFSEQIVEVEISSGLISMFDQIRRLGQGDDRSFSWRLSGGLQVAERLGKVPFSYEGEIDWDPAQD